MSVGSAPTDPETLFRNTVGACLGDRDKALIGLAVSGGGDSIAMLHMAARCFDPRQLRVASVDHGLRPEAMEEIAVVAAQSKALGLAHSVLHWQWDQTGNLQAAARQGRWNAISEWAEHTSVATVLLGHTEDDQVETLLMRLARGSGVDGLTAMSRVDDRDGIRVIRPLLNISRAALRDWLRTQQIVWCDDPSNDDPKFDRIRARQMFQQLESLGLTRKRLLQTVGHMQAAHASLQEAASAFAKTHVVQDAGDLILSAKALDLEKHDIPRRVAAAALSWVGGNVYKPRFERLIDVVGQARDGRTVTLGGCILSPLPGGGIRIIREAAATKETARPATAQEVDATGVIWDRRWFLEGPLMPGLIFRALGDGLRLCPNWRDTGLPHISLRASPSVWRGDDLIAAPLAGFGNGWTAQIVADFHEHTFAH